MALRRSIAAWILWLSAIPGFPQEPKVLSPAGYIAELDRLSGEARNHQKDAQSLREIVRGMPPLWIVQAESRKYTIHSEWLRSGFAELIWSKSEDSYRELQARIEALKTDARALDRTPPDFSSGRATLSRILARREFRRVHGPTWWDKIRQELWALFIEMLRKIFAFSSFSDINKILVWLSIATAIGVLAAAILKIAKRTAKLDAIAIESSFVSDKPWTRWMEEARAAAEGNLWRDSVRLSYRAGISFLEARGAWSPNCARTPREYLRLLSASSEYHGPLSSLTRRFETIWYGGAEAGPDSYAEVLAHLGGLGCRCD